MSDSEKPNKASIGKHSHLEELLRNGDTDEMGLLDLIFYEEILRQQHDESVARQPERAL